MFLHDKNSIFKDQKNNKPKIEEIASDYYKEHKDNILDFIKYLKDNKMTSQWVSVNSWKIFHKSKDVAFLKLYEGSWYVDPIVDFKDSEFELFLKKEKLGTIVLDNIEKCISCLPNGQCTPGRTIKIMGKEYSNVCHSLRFKDPKDNEIECIKKIFEYRKNIITGKGVLKTFYVGKPKRNELIKKYGQMNYDLGYEAIMFFINHNLIKEKPRKDKNFNSYLKTYEKIMVNNPKINFLKLFEMGFEENCK